MNVTYRKKDDLLTRNIAGETIVVPIRGKLADMQSIYALNPVAEFVWEQLDGRRSLDEIAGDVADQFDVGKEQAQSDVREFVSELAAAGLVENL
jgi:hypothetical protein